MNIGIILAAGKGRRFKSSKYNKTVAKFLGKPLVKYGTDLFSSVADKIIVIVGQNARSVINAVGRDSRVIYGRQRLQLGTGHALKIGVGEITQKKLEPAKVWVGYGDHLMFYSPDVLLQLSSRLDNKNTVVSMVTCDHPEPNLLAWGRIIRNSQGNVQAIIEQKEATEKEKTIQELNAGLYCFRFAFLKEGLKALKKSSLTGEFYLTDLIKIAVANGQKVSAVKVPFTLVGIGVNTRQELVQSQKLFIDRGNLSKGGEIYAEEKKHD